MAQDDQKRIVTIERAEHSSENPYFLHTRKSAQDRDRLSYEAIGMLSYLLSKPDGWKIIVEDLKTDKCGRDKVYRIFRELKAAGYLKRELTFGKGHRVTGGRYIISEVPRFINQLTENTEAGTKSTKKSVQVTENPLPGFLVTGNPTLYSTESESTESKESDTTYPFGLENTTENALIIPTIGSAQSLGNILIDDALPTERAEIPPVSTQVKESRLPPRPMSRNSAPQINLTLPPMAKEKGKPVEYWKFDEDGERRDAIPPENGLTPAEKNDFVKDQTKDKRRKGDREQTATEKSRDEWTRAVLRQFGMQDKFDYAEDYKSTHYILYVTSAKALRLAAKDYMSKNAGVTISATIVDAMWGGDKKTGWLFTEKKLDPDRSSPAILSRYFLEYVNSKSSPMAKAKEAEVKAAQVANIVFKEEFDISKYEEEARQRIEAEKARKAKAKAYNPLNTTS